jgi:preprotein translocase subunit SecG
MLLFLNVIYVLVAIAMVALILMQRGAGAQAGSGFGGGASATVFGSRGASSFLTKATKWLAVLFFGISLFMAWHATSTTTAAAGAADLGVMSQVPVAPAQNTAVPATPVESAPATVVPAVPADQAAPPAEAPAGDQPESAPSDATEK